LTFSAGDKPAPPRAESPPQQLEASVRESRAITDELRRVRTIPAPAPPEAARAPSFAGSAPHVRRLREQLEAAAQLRCPVLLTGELGSGRTRAARWLHARAGGRGPFIALRGLPPRSADDLGGATVFAEQLDDAPLALQAAWRGWLAQSPDGVRVIASSGSPWPTQNADAELFAELRRFAIAVPALRERRDDFAVLAADMAREAACELGAAPFALSPGALNALRRAPFLASAADLRRAIEHLAAEARAGETITAPLASAVIAELRPSVAALRERARARERDALLAALSETGGNLARAARRLGCSRAAIYRLIGKHGIALARR
jgi:DNA-binding NtrC family response regulator